MLQQALQIVRDARAVSPRRFQARAEAATAQAMQAVTMKKRARAQEGTLEVRTRRNTSQLGIYL